MSPAATAAASAEERERLGDDFERLCLIESPSLRERDVAGAVARELRSAGLEVTEDHSAAAVGSDSGNLLARIPAPEGARTVLFCAHLDTVPLAAPVEPVLEDGVYRNANAGILGADNKAAVAVLLALARRFARGGAPVGLEFLFTTAEEMALRGAKEVDRSTLHSEFGFVLDHATPIGELVVAAPSYFRIEARFHGAAAHAGLRPEEGRNAIVAAAQAVGGMRLGRLDADTTANAGVIEGGTANNVVAEHCRVELEARSLDDEAAGKVVSEMVDHCTRAAADTECDVETIVEQLFRAYRLPRTAPVVQAAAAALEAAGIEPVYISTGSGSDAAALIAAGLPVLNLANGTARNHQPDEFVTVAALETMLDVCLDLVGRCGDV